MIVRYHGRQRIDEKKLRESWLAVSSVAGGWATELTTKTNKGDNPIIHN